MSTEPTAPLNDEERALAQQLAQPGDQGEPATALDARILAAARTAAAVTPLSGGTQATRRRSQRRWPLALGVAASLVLAVGVAWQLRPLPDGGPADRSEAASAGAAAARPAAADESVVAASAPVEMRVPSQAPAADVEAAQPRAVAVAEDDAPRATAQVKPVADSAAPPSPQVVPAPEPMPPAMAKAAAGIEPAIVFDTAASTAVAADSAAQRARADRSPAGTVAPKLVLPAPTAPPPPSAFARQATADNPAAPVAPRTPMPPPVRARTTSTSSASTAQADTILLPPDTASEASAGAAPADAGLDEPLDTTPPATAAAPQVRDAWLARIRELAGAGRVDEARASLTEFLRRYPDYPLPDDLRPLAP